MKAGHRSDVFLFSVFDEGRDLDFHGTCLARPGGSVLVDPVAMCEHDREHVRRLGPVAWIVVTNSDHVRATKALAEAFGAKVAGPAAERDAFPIDCDRWLEGGETLVPGIDVVALEGSKTPGELALVVDEETLVCGDLVRGHRGGALNLLPDAKLADPQRARASVRGLADRPAIRAVLVGDGWPAFDRGHERLRALVDGG